MFRIVQRIKIGYSLATLDLPLFSESEIGQENWYKVQYLFFYTYQRSTKIGKVQIADVVRCDSSIALQRIVDRIQSGAHIAADNLEKMQEKLMTQSDQHPWIKTLCNAEKVKLLIELAIDVYNDSRQLTLSAHSRSAKSIIIENSC